MCFIRSSDFRNSFPNQGVGDDEFRFAVVVLLGAPQCVEKGLHVLAVNFLNVEPVGFEARAGVFALGRFRRRVERDRVAIVNQNQIVEPEVSGERTRFGRHAFLQTTIARETNAMLIENAVFWRVEARGRHFHCNGNSNRVSNALTKRTSRALDSWSFKKLRMTGRFGVQLPETLDFRHRQIVAAHVQPGVKKHAAVPRREHEIIAANPTRLVGIVLERVTVENGTHFGAAERKT